jgi:hypothetical protein
MTTSPHLDKLAIDDSFAAMDEAIGARKSSATGIILRIRTLRLAAAAAVIMVAVTLLMVREGPREQQPLQKVASNVEKSPAKMLSMISLNIAYRRGGIEAVDNQSYKAFKMLGSQYTTVSIQELLTSFNGI